VQLVSLRECLEYQQVETSLEIVSRHNLPLYILVS
jgi:hypothetical protein